MFLRSSLWYKLIAVVMIIALLLPVLAACDDDGEDEILTPTKTAESTAEAASAEPVKLGVVFPYTGAQAMYGPAVADPFLKVMRRQIEDRGGILGGRPVEFIIEDNKSETAATAAAVTKLITSDNVSAILFGGANDAQHTATEEVCLEYGIPYFTQTFATEEGQTNPYRFAAGMPPFERIMDMVVDFVISKLEAKTVAFLMSDLDEHRTQQGYMKELLENAGVKIVTTQWVDYQATDLSSYVTKIKYEDPDVLITTTTVPGHYINLYKQFAGQGGFGDIQVVAAEQVQLAVQAHMRPEAVGAYFWTPWFPGIDTPGGKEYERAWYAVHEKEGMMIVNATLYTVTHMCLAAIEEAGSGDPEKIWEAAKSGKVVWEEGLLGPTTLLADGTIDTLGMMVEIIGDGKLARVQ